MTKDSQDPTTGLAEVVKRHLRGEPPADIAARLSLPPGEVNRLLGLARRRWGEAARSRRAETHTLVTDLGRLELRFRSEWDRRGPGLPPTPADNPLGVGRTLEEDQSGYSHLLAVAGRSLLLPLASESVRTDVCPSSPAAHDEVAGLSLEEVEDEITRLAYGLGLGKKKTPR